MALRRFPAYCKTITGYILQKHRVVLPKQDDVSDDRDETEGEEEEGQPAFLDITEMNSVSSGGKLFQSSAPSLKEVNLKVGKDVYLVRGRFILRDPWWSITCKVSQDQRKWFVTGFPSYSLRADLRSEGQSIVSLFLKACGASPDFVKTFMEWLPENRHVTPVNVMEALLDFEKSKPEHKAIAEELKSRVSNSVAGRRVRVASTFPNIMRYIPTLLPWQFLAIISKERKASETDAEELAKLENLMTTSDVWKLGFNYIMFKEFHLIRCEAKVEAFKFCDLYKNIPQLQQNCLLLYDKLKDYCSFTGSTYIEREKLVEKIRGVAGIEGAWKAVCFLEEQGVLMRERRKVALQNLFSYENGIAECLWSLVMGQPWKIRIDQLERLRAKASERDNSNHGKKSDADAETSDSALNDSTCFGTVDLDPEQVKAALMICANPLTVISGKGGSGKTTVVSLVLKTALQQQQKNHDSDKKPPMEVLLTAPTGRAASLLTKKNGFKAYTMHQVLWSFMKAKRDPFGNPEDWKFSKVRVLVVDEGSLVSVQILHSVLSMLTKHAQLQKFILLGDVRQLPSIQPGNTLCDLFEGLRNVHWAVEMRTNHRAESELIVRNAGLISEKNCSLEFDATIDMTRPSTISPDTHFIFVKLCGENHSFELQNAIQFILEKAPGLESDRSSQFVAFTRKDCEFVNELCCKHYSDHVTKTPKNEMNFQKGDKVCCTRNGFISEDVENEQDETSTDPAEAPDSAERKTKERLHNGEVFFITEDVTKEDLGARHKKRRYLTLDDENGRVVTCSFRELQRECKLRHAWARTIHTFQGSEAETIVYVLGESRAQNWQHFYTAVTRGQKRVYVVGTKGNMEQAIRKPIIPRNTRLCGLIKEKVGSVVPKRPAESDICSTQSKLSK